MPPNTDQRRETKKTWSKFGLLDTFELGLTTALSSGRRDLTDLVGSDAGATISNTIGRKIRYIIPADWSEKSFISSLIFVEE